MKNLSENSCSPQKTRNRYYKAYQPTRFQDEEPQIQALEEKKDGIDSKMHSKIKEIEKEYKESEPKNIDYKRFRYEDFCNYYKMKEDPKDISSLKEVLRNIKTIKYSENMKVHIKKVKKISTMLLI